MQPIKNVCVYCGASNRVSDDYKQVAKEVGRVLAEQQLNLVYGGGRMGLMGIVADSVLENGGKVTGITTKHIQDREVRHDDLSELHIVDNMHIRKQMMAERSDAFIILPGGYGTLEEAFEMLTWKQIGLHQKPLLFLNIKGFWNPLKDLKQHLFEESFIKAEDLKLFSIVDTTDQIVPALLAQAQVQPVPASA